MYLLRQYEVLNGQYFLTMESSMLQELISIGFSEKEARLYSALVELGETTIGPLEKKLRVHKQILYNLLKRLEQRGAVLVTNRNGRKHFNITDPDILRLHIESQKAIVESLVPKIYDDMGIQRQISEIRIYDGVAAVQAFHLKMFKQCSRGAEIEILGAGGDAFLKIARQRLFFERYENIRVSKKISHKLLMYENQRKVEPGYTQRRYVEAKYLPEEFTQPIATQIWPDRVAILLFDETPRIVEIKSAKIVEGFRHYFAMLWKMG